MLIYYRCSVHGMSENTWPALYQWFSEIDCTVPSSQLLDHSTITLIELKTALVGPSRADSVLVRTSRLVHLAERVQFRFHVERFPSGFDFKFKESVWFRLIIERVGFVPTSRWERRFCFDSTLREPVLVPSSNWDIVVLVLTAKWVSASV